MTLYLAEMDPLETLGAEPVLLCDQRHADNDRELDVPAKLAREMVEPCDLPPGRWFTVPASTLARLVGKSD